MGQQHYAGNAWVSPIEPDVAGAVGGENPDCDNNGQQSRQAIEPSGGAYRTLAGVRVGGAL